MEQGTKDNPKFVNDRKDTAISVQSLEKQEQLCVGKHDHHQNFSGQHTATSSKQQLAIMADNNQSSNKQLARDRLRLLQILPEELWRIVFKKLDSSDDHLERVSNSSLFFRELLLTERKNFLFKNMWKILGCQENKYFGDADKMEKKRDVGTSEINSDDLEELLMEVIFRGPPSRRLKKEILYEKNGPTKESLSLRLVCQSWSKGIDSLYEYHNLKTEVLADATALLAHFDATHDGSTSSTRSPFLSKSIAISVDWRGIEVVKNGVHAMLDKYGHHFSNFFFLADDLLPPAISFYSKFRMLLQRMPSLKKLRIWYMEMLWQSSVERRVLDTGMIFPTLPGLEELTVDGGKLPLPIFRQLMRINGHASTSSTTTGAHPDGPFVSSLKSLSVQPCPQSYFEIITGNQLEWHLTSLCLHLPDCRVTEWPSVFNALKNKFGNTLTHLRLTLARLDSKADGDRILEESKQFKEHFPHLTHLELEVAVVNSMCDTDDMYVMPMKDYNRVFTVFAKDAEEWHVKYSKTWGWRKCRDLWQIAKLAVAKQSEYYEIGEVIPDEAVSFGETWLEWKEEMQNTKGSTLVRALKDVEGEQ